MSTTEILSEIHGLCSNVREKYQKELEEILDNYFLEHFINEHRRWRAVLGNNHCRPIVINRDFSPLESYQDYPLRYHWPNYSYEMLKKELTKLGFVVDITPNHFYLYVSAGKSKYAHRKVRKINQAYGQYCANEKAKANRLYSQFLNFIAHAEKSNIYVLSDKVTLFKIDFPVLDESSDHCKRYFYKMMTKDGFSFFQDKEKNLRGYIINT